MGLLRACDASIVISKGAIALDVDQRLRGRVVLYSVAMKKTVTPITILQVKPRKLQRPRQIRRLK